jgi:hypothetical protein
MMRHRKGVLAAAAGALVSATVLFAATSAGGLIPPDPDEVIDSVQICHRTNSNQNPYIINEPDATGDVSGHADHTGPVWNDTLKAQHITWGDIIPPFTFDGGTFPGLNWNAEGQAIYANDCNPVEPPELVFGSLTVTKTVVGPIGTPTGTLPTSFTVHVVCDDLVTNVNVTFPASGGAGTPPTINNIEAGSTCIVSETGTGSFPPGTVVTYSPVGANTTGVLVDENHNVQVGVTNSFASAPTAPTVAAEAVTVQPAFTG